MKHFFMQIAAAVLSAALMLPSAFAAGSDTETIRVGLAYGSGALVSANLENNTGYGSGYRFGYFEDDLDFVELGRTEEDETQITMLKTQNTWVLGGVYSASDNGGEAIGCYHVQVGSYPSYSRAEAAAEEYSGGFVAWIDGEYQVRVGAYTTQSAAQSAQESLGEGEVVGTSGYGVNAVRTGTAEILFQFDGGSGSAFGVMPDVTGDDSVRTWFKGYRYYGGFRYERISGGNLTVVNVVDLETYIKGVIPYEMSNSWPKEALKVQAVCARSYAYHDIRSQKHSSYHFDICNTTHCQVYCGAGTASSTYQANDRTDQAVDETAGEYAWYNGSVIEAFYASSHGGASEDVYNVWGSSREEYPYLCGVIDPYEADMDSRNANSSWSVSYTASTLKSRLRSYGYGGGADVSSLILTYSDLGNVIQIKVVFSNGESNTFKPNSKNTIYSVFGVKSLHFTVNGQGASSAKASDSGSASASGSLTVNGSGTLDGQGSYAVIRGTGTTAKEDLKGLYTISGSGTISKVETSSGGDSSSGTNSGGTPTGKQLTITGSSFVFQGSGNGHQLGMSQYGAWAMVERGFSYEEVIEFYYPGTYVK